MRQRTNWCVQRQQRAKKQKKQKKFKRTEEKERAERRARELENRRQPAGSGERGEKGVRARPVGAFCPSGLRTAGRHSRHEPGDEQIDAFQQRTGAGSSPRSFSPHHI